MASNTVMMYFKLTQDSVTSDNVIELLQEVGVLSLGALAAPPVCIAVGGKGEQIIVFQGVDKSHATLRTYLADFITLDVHHCVADENNPPLNIELLEVKKIFTGNKSKIQLSEEYVRCLQQKIVAHLGPFCIGSNCLDAPIRRGEKFWTYSSFSDERLVEFDFDHIVLETQSKWQRITIAHSTEHGNVLLLDGDIMLGESDLVYTETLCCIGSEDYKNKTVLILGGGDGGILHELMKQQPAFITMAEIDEEVIKACRTHMRSVCGEELDTYETEHYKIIIDDCIAVLHDNIQRGIKYDYVINDLTEFPVDKAVKGYGYDFETSSLITELSLKVVKDGGKMLARGHCLSAHTFRSNFEQDLATIGCKFKCNTVHIPSFMETYCMYEVWKDG